MSPDPTPVTVGFVPLLDAALLVAAREEGFAAAEGLDLRLVREGSWAAVRDKLNAGLFDAAHMLAPAAIASTLGIGHLKVPLKALCGLNLDGNAITVSRELAQEMEAAARVQPLTPARSAAVMADLAAARARQPGAGPLTVGVVFGFSCHLYQVRAWLKLGGLDPEGAARFVVIPPPLMAESLSLGQIDLFCAGAPWNRVAEQGGAGRILHACSEIAPSCPEKWLVMRADRAQEPAAAALIRAVASAAQWAAEPFNRPILARHLARPDYVGVPSPLIEALLGPDAPTLAGPSAQPWIRLDPAVTPIAPAQVERLHAMMRDAGHLDAAVTADDLAEALIMRTAD